MLHLYSIPGSCSTGIHVLLNKLGREFELVKRDEVENYAALVPTNQVPALVDEDTLLVEGAAIVLHLLGEHGLAPLPGPETQQFNRWLMFNYATLHPTYSQLFLAGVKNVVTHPESRQVLIDHVAQRLSTLWAIVDAHLEGRDFMLGEQATIIDYLLAIYANWGNSVPEANVEIGPNARRLVESVLELPEFAAAVAREGIEVKLPPALSGSVSNAAIAEETRRASNG